MGDHEDGLTLAVHLAEQMQQLIGGLGVQRTGRLIGQNNAGVGNHCAGHGGALLLTAGDFVGVLFQQCGNAQLIGNGRQTPVHLLIALACQHQRQIDVILQSKGVQQIELLKYKTQMIAAERCHIGFLNAGEIFAV